MYRNVSFIFLVTKALWRSFFFISKENRSRQKSFIHYKWAGSETVLRTCTALQQHSSHTPATVTCDGHNSSTGRWIKTHTHVGVGAGMSW